MILKADEKPRAVSLLIRCCPFGGSCSSKNGQDIAEAKIVVWLLAQLLLAEAIQHIEFLGQDFILLVATRGQLDLPQTA